MMDATNLYPLGFHPMSDDRLPDDIHTYAPTVSRSNTSVTYYFTDFGISTMFDKEATTKLVTGIDGLDEDVPELSREVPYDPFKTDIFILGNMFGKTFVSVSSASCTIVGHPSNNLIEICQCGHAHTVSFVDDCSRPFKASECGRSVEAAPGNSRRSLGYTTPVAPTPVG